MNDMELLAQLNTDPDRAMASLIEQYTGLVYSIIHSKISSVGTAEDVRECVSDVFVEFYRQAGQIDPAKCSVKGYLAVLAKYKGIDLYRKLKGVSGHLIQIEAPYDEFIDDRSNPEQEIIRREQAKLLRKAIEALGEPDDEIFIRKYYLGQKTREIAKAIHLRENTVDKKVSRGLKKLRILLGGADYEETKTV